MKEKIKYILFFAVLFISLHRSITVFAEDTAKSEKADSQIYGIGSVSKIFATTAVMKLSEEGKIDLDAPVTDYIPEFIMADDRYLQITVRMLLNHSSGIMGTTEQSCFLFGDGSVDYYNVLLEELKTQRLKAAPGDFSVYCNDGFTLAEIIVTRVSGMSFGDYVKKEITEPLGIKATGMPTELEPKEDFAPIYYNNRKLPFENIKSQASGGIYSSPEDLCRFAQTFMDNGNNLLSKESTAAMASPEYMNNKIGVQEGDTNFNYGLGWDSVNAYPFSRYKIKSLMKGGDTSNYGAGLIVLPELNISAAVTVSGGSGQYSQMMAQEIITEVLKEEGLLTYEEETAAKTPLIQAVSDTDKEKKVMEIPKELRQYAGIYAANEIFQVEFTKENRLKITSLENDSDMVQEYMYTKSGDFVSTNGKYISYTGLAQASGGVSGITGFRFREEANGKIYIIGTTYSMAGGSAESAVTEPFAEKIVENDISDETAAVWEARNGKKYYLISDVYNSSYYMKNPVIEVETLTASPGYTKALSTVKNCRIIDEDHAVCGLELPVMIGRDLLDYRFYRKDGAEYLELGGNIFLEEGAQKDTKELNDRVTMGNEAQWYRIDEADAGRELQIEVPQQGAYYILDKDGSCMSASYLEGEKDKVILPKGGRILFTGEEGEVFHISR